MVTRKESSHYEVWEENWHVFEVFMACETQWRTNSMAGGLIGLDYQGLKAALEMMEVHDKRQAFDDIRAMEKAVIKEANKDVK